MTLTVLLEKFGTKALVPSGLKATEYGAVPTVMVLTTVFEAVLMTLTVAAPELVT